jgi:hypothetical protein
MNYKINVITESNKQVSSQKHPLSFPPRLFSQWRERREDEN